MKIKKDDKVVVLSGKDKGKQGKVLIADPKGAKVVVEGVNVATKHQKPRKQGEEGGIIKVETPIYVSKVQLDAPSAARAPASATGSPTARRSASARSAAQKSERKEKLNYDQTERKVS